MLVAAGAVVGIATVTAIATGYEIQLTPEMIQLLTYKAFGAAAVGLIVVGTWIGRGGSKKDRDTTLKPDVGARDISEGPAAPALRDRSVEAKTRRAEVETEDG